MNFNLVNVAMTRHHVSVMSLKIGVKSERRLKFWNFLFIKRTKNPNFKMEGPKSERKKENKIERPKLQLNQYIIMIKYFEHKMANDLLVNEIIS